MSVLALGLAGCDLNVKDAASELGGYPSSSVSGLRVTVYPASTHCGAQLNTDPMVFVFSASMSTAFIDFLTTTGVSVASQVWSTTTLTNDTLTITPSPTWPASGSFDFPVFSASGQPLTVFWSMNAGSALPNFFYVNGDTGNDANDGLSPGTAVQTLAQAITNITTAVPPLLPAVVHVAKASTSIPFTVNLSDSGNPYQGYDVGTNGLAMVDQVHMCGGFNGSFTARDPNLFPTVLVNTSATYLNNTSSGVPGTNTVLDGSATVGATTVDGFVLVAAGPDTIAGYSDLAGYTTGAFQNQGGGPTQVRNTLMISGGTLASVIAFVASAPQNVFTNTNLKASPVPPTSNTTYGLYVNNMNVVFDSGYVGSSTIGIYILSGVGTSVISNNDIDGGTNNNQSMGIQTVAGGTVNILNNTEIHGGTANNPYGIFFSTTDGTISGNGLIDAGTGAAGTSYGIWISGPPTGVTVQNNGQITGGTSATGSTVGIHVDTGGGVTIDGNTLITGGSGYLAATGIETQNNDTTISNNPSVLAGIGTGPSAQTIAINASGSGTMQILSNGTIGNGTATSDTYGIFVTGGLALMTVDSNNQILGGTAGSTIGKSTGIGFSGGSIAASNNLLIDGGISPTSASTALDLQAGTWNVQNNPAIRGGTGTGTSTGINLSGGNPGPTIQGNTINGGTSPGITSGIIDSASGANILNNTIYGGSGSTNFSAGIHGINPSGGGSYNANTINGGTGSGSTFGIFDTNGAHIFGNVINGGSGGSIGVGLRSQLTGVGAVYEQNTISGGRATSLNEGIDISGSPSPLTLSNNLISGCGKYGGATPFTCYGISVGNVTGTQIWNNTINGGSGSTASSNSSVGIFDAGTSTSMINNIIFTSANGVLGTSGNTTCVDVTTATSPAFAYNDMYGCPDITYSGVYNTTLNPTPGVNPVFVSLGADPGQVDAADVNWHLTGSSPAVITSGGDGVGGACAIPMSGLPDRDGLTRGANPGMSMGAYRMPGDPGTGGC